MGPDPAWLRRYRSTGADLPWGNPERAHGVAMEGYFWRITTPSRVVVALIGVNRGPRGPWSTVGVATSSLGSGTGFVPGRLVTTALEDGRADPNGLGAHSGDVFHGTDRLLRVDLPGAHLEATIEPDLRWPRPVWGGSSVFHVVPALNQYWHPWLLGGRATGRVTVADDEFDFTDAQVYGEKNWGRGGFPEAWWWGQAHGFPDEGACVAFAGGQVSAGPLHTEVTGLVVRLPDGRVVRLGDPVVTPVRATVGDDRWQLSGRSSRWRIDVDAHAPVGQAHVLPVPLPREQRNTAGALEHLTGDLRVVVREWGRVVWSADSAMAGLERGGLALAQGELARRGGRPTPAGAP
ncbi:tocopherol cyclase family protein [Aestuariimicrobium kwangyangense]|uniref:tocopherol cyclase family protein n=1 Tax=Aestuariimicrobium kwangyangense TaxID=396389 RepID=UPI00059079FD|nr:tocopherol cyclase family protein [Aestuariimicrobium kwangyangense]